MRPVACLIVAALALAGPPAAGNPFDLQWDPVTGKGRVTQTLPGGDRYGISIHHRYEGYAGGLWLGSQNSSGFLWVPRSPPPGFATLNLFCAQDESILDEETGLEWTPGWSENFGRGDDGERLAYVRGEVLADGSGENGVVLSSVNAGGCFEVSKYLWWPEGAEYLLVSTAVRDTCDRPVRMAFWTGEDSWIGRYASAEGDAGWWSGGVTRVERCVDGRAFRFGGLVDLGAAGPRAAGRPASNAANFIMPDPSLPPPVVACFASRFAHGPAEVLAGRPLDDTKMIAFNLGWTGLVLAPGGEVRFRYALGRAETGAPGSVPRPPEIPPARWAFDDLYRTAAFRPAGRVARAPRLPVRFAREAILMTVIPPDLEVEATYVLVNRTSSPQSASLLYPFPIDENHPYPYLWEVDGAAARAGPTGLVWRVDLGPSEEREVRVRYRQLSFSRDARYILTSTGRWGEPLEHAVYEVRWPAHVAGMAVSYGGTVRLEEGMRVLRFERRDFEPPRDLAVRWE